MVTLNEVHPFLFIFNFSAWCILDRSQLLVCLLQLQWLIKQKILVIGLDWFFRQTKDVMKLLKKRLGSKIPKVQLLTLFVSNSTFAYLSFLFKFYMFKACGWILYIIRMLQVVQNLMNAKVKLAKRHLMSCR